jgi:hypothetical protein
MNRIASVDRVLDEVLVQLGGMVLRLSSPDVTRTPQERRSGDPRVHQLKAELEATIEPHLRLVASR